MDKSGEGSCRKQQIILCITIGILVEITSAGLVAADSSFSLLAFSVFSFSSILLLSPKDKKNDLINLHSTYILEIQGRKTYICQCSQISRTSCCLSKMIDKNIVNISSRKRREGQKVCVCEGWGKGKLAYIHQALAAQVCHL